MNGSTGKSRGPKRFLLSLSLSPSSMPSPLTLTTGSVSFLGFPHFSFFHSLLSPALSLSAFSQLGFVLSFSVFASSPHSLSSSSLCVCMCFFFIYFFVAADV